MGRIRSLLTRGVREKINTPVTPDTDPMDNSNDFGASTLVYSNQQHETKASSDWHLAMDGTTEQDLHPSSPNRASSKTNLPEEDFGFPPQEPPDKDDAHTLDSWKGKQSRPNGGQGENATWICASPTSPSAFPFSD